jgi:hypothetical protein
MLLEKTPLSNYLGCTNKIILFPLLGKNGMNEPANMGKKTINIEYT